MVFKKSVRFLKGNKCHKPCSTLSSMRSVYEKNSYGIDLEKADSIQSIEKIYCNKLSQLGYLQYP
ncbi:hypothetical protein ES703_87334 [subsurface metagenome]